MCTSQLSSHSLQQQPLDRSDGRAAYCPPVRSTEQLLKLPNGYKSDHRAPYLPSAATKNLPLDRDYMADKAGPSPAAAGGMMYNSLGGHTDNSSPLAGTVIPRRPGYRSDSRAPSPCTSRERVPVFKTPGKLPPGMPLPAYDSPEWARLQPEQDKVPSISISKTCRDAHALLNHAGGHTLISACDCQVRISAPDTKNNSATYSV